LYFFQELKKFSFNDRLMTTFPGRHFVTSNMSLKVFFSGGGESNF